MYQSLSLETVARNINSDYDLARLSLYQQNSDHFSDIQLRPFGIQSVAARFPEVSFFNKLHLPHHDLLPRWNEMLEFYGPRTKFYSRTPSGSGISKVMEQMGGRRITSYYTLMGELTHSPEEELELAPIRFVRVGHTEATTFAKLYLELFSACPNRLQAAISNLSMLHRLPGLQAYLLIEGRRAVGMELLYISGESALLAGGAIRPEARHRGYHRASIRHRLAIAKSLGCKYASAWTYGQNAAYFNLVQGGLTQSYVEDVFQFQGK